MMTKFQFKKKVILLFSFLFLLFSCGDIQPKGSIETKEIPLEDFESVVLNGKFQVFYAKGTKNALIIETYPNIADNLSIEIEDKTLSIKENRATKKVDFYNLTLYSKYPPNTISISDSVEFNASSAIKTDQFNLILKNNAIFIGSISSRKSNIEMEQKSRANFLGFTERAQIKISDTASLIAPYWKLKNLEITSKNGNYAEVNVLDTLKGSIKNTSRLLYYNDPIQKLSKDKTTTIIRKKLP